MVYFYKKILRLNFLFLLTCLKGTLSIQGKYTKNVESYQIVYPMKVPSSEQSNHGYRRSSSQEPTIHYKLNLRGVDEYIDLVPSSHILSPNAVFESRLNTVSDNDPLINIKLNKFSPHKCFFKGKVRNYNDSSTALSTCDGLCGFIRVQRHTYFIEPVSGQTNSSKQGDLPHVLYEEFSSNSSPLNCATGQTPDMDDSSFPKSGTESATKPLYIETLIVLDKSMTDTHSRKDLQNYVLTVFNMAQSLFHDLSTNPPINLEVVRMIEVEDEKDSLNVFQKGQLGIVGLQRFSDWQHRINPRQDTHPNHHDLAVLLTRKELCDDKEDCHYIGIAENGGLCKREKQAAICKDSGLILGYIIAHEIAHTLGIGHDSGENALSSVMSPVITFKSKEWSESSRSVLKSAIERNELSCLEDEPTWKMKMADILPGVLYNGDYQCQQLFNRQARNCNKPGECQSLSCQFEGASCSKTGLMLAPGTSCGVNKWCYDGECLEAGRKPNAVQGGWRAWSEWSQCSRTCGAGVSSSVRECDSPLPRHGGKSCVGSKKRYKICTTQPCEIGSHPFRDIQCAEYNNWKFPEDRAKHKWKGFFIHSGNPCALYCRNERDVVVSLSPKVKDGTTCYRGIRDICVDGICRNIPCDLQFDSKSIEDGCGICHGSGTECNILQGIKDVAEGVSKVLTIPEGTRKVLIEETNRTPSHFILKKHNTDRIINEGKRLGMFNVSGSVAWLGMTKPNLEILEIPGPLAEPVDVWIKSDGAQLVSYSMGLPLPGKPREGKYSWDYIDWSHCMSQCGDGLQESVPKCLEESSGLVEDKYCILNEKPPVKTRPCNAGICFPRWFIGEWEECGPCPNREARRFRLVQCVRPTTGLEGIAIIDDGLCQGVRPPASQHCRCIKRQVVNLPPPQSYLNEFKNLLGEKRDRPMKKTAEKKVTLMQLENESEESMLKQFKENQLRHHTLFYMPRLLGYKFNFSIPFRKKRHLQINKNTYKRILNKFSDLIKRNTPYSPVYIPINWMTIRRKGNLTLPNNYMSYIGPKHAFGSVMDLTNKVPIQEQTDTPPLLFTVQNTLKLRSYNLPLEKLKNSIKSKASEVQINKLHQNDIFAGHKGKKNMGILDLLLNEFYDILSADKFIKSNLNKLPKNNFLNATPDEVSIQRNDQIMKLNRILQNIYSNFPNYSKANSVSVTTNFNDLDNNNETCTSSVGQIQENDVSQKSTIISDDISQMTSNVIVIENKHTPGPSNVNNSRSDLGNIIASFLVDLLKNNYSVVKNLSDEPTRFLRQANSNRKRKITGEHSFREKQGYLTTFYEKNVDFGPFEKEIVFHPKNIEIIKLIGKVKRDPTCDKMDRELLSWLNNNISNL